MVAASKTSHHLYPPQLQRHGEVGGWLYRAGWFFAASTQTALAALAGIAVASAFRAKTSDAVGAHR